jgi:glycyl-tRNA synthetase beta chain
MNSKLETGNSKFATEDGVPESRVPSPQSLPLLLEIGCEEIPARFLAQAQKDLRERLAGNLAISRLLDPPTGPLAELGERAAKAANASAFSTPRRLAAYVPEVFERQLDETLEVLGPPVKVAFDAEGKPTRTAESFAQKNGVKVEALLKVSTPKGEYVQAKKVTPGKPAVQVLHEILPTVIAGLTFPKSMYWESSKLRFVRPIRWILALLGRGEEAQVVSFEVAGVKSSGLTYGHRALGTAPAAVTGFGDYAPKLRQLQVEIDPEKRRWMVLDGIEVLLKLPGLSAMKGHANILRAGAGETDPEARLEAIRSRVKALPEELESDLRLIEDRDLEDWVVNSTEWPHALLGGFEERFLKLPREILITVMRDHQKYFAVENSAGELQPRFVTVLNVPGDPKGLIRAGHERVLTARFSDAEFFWAADQKVPLRDRLPMLEKVTYQAKLGSYGDKVRRMDAIAKELCSTLQGQGNMTRAEADHALRATQLCKCDLTTQMVQEFTELQGVVGGLYAASQEEPPEVADAIYDHYRPAGLDDKLPRSIVGAVVSLADKIDSLACGFAAGREPTGSSDPFGLRRQGNGIIKILLEFGIAIDLRQTVEQPLYAAMDQVGERDPQARGALLAFLEERLRFYFETARHIRYDTVRAVLAAGWNVPIEALHRAEAVERIRGSEDFLALSAAAKRIKNILAKSATANDWAPGEVEEALLQEGPEAALYHAYRGVAAEAARHVDSKDDASKDYTGALQAIATLRKAVDLFFDKVLVMAEDRALRQNRLRLLGKLDELFSGIAHFSEIEGNVDASTL